MGWREVPRTPRTVRLRALLGCPAGLGVLAVLLREPRAPVSPSGSQGILNTQLLSRVLVAGESHPLFYVSRCVSCFPYWIVSLRRGSRLHAPCVL